MWWFFVLINARPNGNIYRVKKSNISLTHIFLTENRVCVESQAQGLFMRILNFLSFNTSSLIYILKHFAIDHFWSIIWCGYVRRIDKYSSFMAIRTPDYYKMFEAQNYFNWKIFYSSYFHIWYFIQKYASLTVEIYRWYQSI